MPKKCIIFCEIITSLCPVLDFLSWLSLPGCIVLVSCPDCPFWLSCLGRLFQDVLSRPSCPDCPFLPVLSLLPYPHCSVQVVLSCLYSAFSHRMPVPFLMCCPSCPFWLGFVIIVSELSCLDCPSPCYLLLVVQPWLSCPGCYVLAYSLCYVLHVLFLMSHSV